MQCVLVWLLVTDELPTVCIEVHEATVCLCCGCAVVSVAAYTVTVATRHSLHHTHISYAHSVGLTACFSTR